jgi:hypothetical protein
MQHPFQLCQQSIFSVLSVPVIIWQEITVTIKKKEVLPLFVSVNALLFSMQYGHASFSCVLQPESIP